MAKRLDKKTNQENSINSNRRKLLGLAGTAGAGMLLSPLLSEVAPSTIIEAGSNVDTASYIIFKNGNNIYAKNGTMWKIEFQGTDTTIVIQSVIDISESGSEIKIRRGEYIAESNFHLFPKLEIIWLK